MPVSNLPELMRTVPSDALAVLDYSRCDKGMQMQLDSNTALSKLDLKGFRSSRMVLSYVFMGGLVPVLAIDAGRASADTTADVRALLAQADTLKLSSSFLAGGIPGGKRAVVLISTSEAALPSVDRHLESHSSIVQAPGFAEAFRITGGREDWIYLRNSGLDKSLPRNFLSRYLSARQTINFLQGCADWLVADASDGSGKMSVYPVSNGAMSQYVTVLEASDAAECKISSILPQDTEFVLDIAIGPDFRRHYEDYTDARSKLEHYNKRLAELRKSSGEDPEAWEREAKIQEVAVVQWNNRKVVLYRPAKAPKGGEIDKNPRPGFTGALYGSAFELDNDQYCAPCGKWVVMGSEPDVAAFLQTSSFMQTSGWPQKECKFVAYAPSFMIYGNNKNIVLNKLK